MLFDFLQIPNILRPRFQKNTYDVLDEMSLEVFETKLPPYVTMFSEKALRDVVRGEIATFKWVDYNLHQQHLHEHEWHSLQMSFILLSIKREIFIAIDHIEDYFCDEVLNYTEDELKEKVNIIFHRYINLVNPKLDKQDLEKDFKWSPFEASVLFRYISIYCHPKQ